LLNAQLERWDRRLQQTESEQRRVADLYQMQAIDRVEIRTRQQEVIGRQQQLERERELLLVQRQELAANNHFIAFFNRTLAEPFKGTYLGKPLHA
jgi:hypothetical protein